VKLHRGGKSTHNCISIVICSTRYIEEKISECRNGRDPKAKSDIVFLKTLEVDPELRRLEREEDIACHAFTSQPRSTFSAEPVLTEGPETVRRHEPLNKGSLYFAKSRVVTGLDARGGDQSGNIREDVSK
jgi:hypothetical protein